jgi:hypothetical protein
MSKKKKLPRGVWSGRRQWLMNFLTAFVVLVLGKVWDAFRLPNPPAAPSAPVTRSLPPATSSLSVYATDYLSVTESLSIRVIRKP